ncbi:occludin-like [Aplochiton taeniatus]
MFEKQRYDSPPVYSPPYKPPSNGYGPPGSFQSPRSEFDPYPPPPGSYYIEEKPQRFYKWLSPPGIIKAMMGVIIVLCVGIFACVASTLMWDMNYGYGQMGMGSYGSGMGGYGGYGGMGSYGSGYGGGGGYGYGNYYSSYPTPYSAKTSMIAMAAINFIVSLGFFIASFSKTAMFRSRKFFLVVLVVSIIMAILQGIINIVYIVGVNPMAQSSSSMMYNPMLMMCQNLYGTSYSQMGGVGGFPMYNQYLYHYCFVDPQEGVAMVCGFLVVFALAVAAFFAHKTRGKIWRYGKPNIFWEEPLTGGMAPEGRDVEDWVNNVEDSHSTQDAPTLVLSEKAGIPLNNSANSVISYPAKPDSGLMTDTYNNTAYSERPTSHPLVQPSSGGGASSSPSEEAVGVRKPSANRGKRRRRNPELDESQYETEYTTGGDTGNELDTEEWDSIYPEITSDAQRHEYKREFDADLKDYKRLCADMDDINDQMNKMSRQLDTLDENSAQYQIVAEEYNQLKDVKRTSDYQSKKLECRRLRHKLFHIKRMVKDYDKYHS